MQTTWSSDLETNLFSASLMSEFLSPDGLNLLAKFYFSRSLGWEKIWHLGTGQGLATSGGSLYSMLIYGTCRQRPVVVRPRGPQLLCLLKLIIVSRLAPHRQ